MNFKVSVNSNLDLEISSEDVTKLDAIKISENSYHLLHNNKSYHSEIISSNFNSKSYEVKINNNSYHISILNDLDMLIKEFLSRY